MANIKNVHTSSWKRREEIKANYSQSSLLILYFILKKLENKVRNRDKKYIISRHNVRTKIIRLYWQLCLISKVFRIKLHDITYVL